jgi:hypothetical protein
MITKPMTSTERSARHRAKLKARGPKAKAKPFTSSDEIYAALVEQRNLTSAFDRALAMEVVDALVRGDLAEAVRALALLPAPAVRVETSRTVSAADAKAKLFALVENAIAADKVEAEQHEQREVAALRAEVARLRAKCGEQPVEGVPSVTTPSGGSYTGEKAITPRDGDIVPPREQSDNPQNMRGPHYDAPRGRAKALLGDGPIIDAEPVKPTPTPSGAWNGPHDGPPPWLQTPAQNAARAAVKASPPPAAASAAPPAAPAAPTPSSQRTPAWDSTPGGQAWRTWCDAGGYSGDGLCAAGWIDKLNGR